MTSVDWSDVVANDFQIPANHPLPELTHGLSELLRSPEPALRDGVAYSTLATWISRGQVTHRLLVELGDEMAIRFADPEVQARTVAPLVLAVRASENIVEERWIVAFEQWWPAEGDVRGYDPVLGWLHAVAHGADLAGELGRCSVVAPGRMLELVTARMTARSTHVWRDGEDDRVGAAIAHILTRQDLGLMEATSWLEPLEKVMRTSGAMGTLAEVSNSTRSLRSLYLLLATGVRVGKNDAAVVPPYAADVQRRIVDVLHHATPWLW